MFFSKCWLSGFFVYSLAILSKSVTQNMYAQQQFWFNLLQKSEAATQGTDGIETAKNVFSNGSFLITLCTVLSSFWVCRCRHWDQWRRLQILSLWRYDMYTLYLPLWWFLIDVLLQNLSIKFICCLHAPVFYSAVHCEVGKSQLTSRTPTSNRAGTKSMLAVEEQQEESRFCSNGSSNGLYGGKQDLHVILPFSQAVK